MLHESEYVKLKMTVPITHLEQVRTALGQTGAGKLGSYDFCTYEYPVTGHFRPLSGAHPTIGQIGNREKVQEYCIECICHKDLITQVIDVVKKVHPYEEIAYDIIPRLEM